MTAGPVESCGYWLNALMPAWCEIGITSCYHSVFQSAIHMCLGENCDHVAVVHKRSMTLRPKLVTDVKSLDESYSTAVCR